MNKVVATVSQYKRTIDHKKNPECRISTRIRIRIIITPGIAFGVQIFPK